MSKSAANRVLRAGLVMLAVMTANASRADVSALSSSDPVRPFDLVDGLSSEMMLAFDWFSNAAPILPGTTATRSLRKVIPGRGGWICSPAGFGQHSTCYQG
jgi:hypothetical protein